MISLHPFEARPGRRHQRGDPIDSELLANPLDPAVANSQLFRPGRGRSVVEVGRAVERGGEVHVVRPAELDHPIVEQGEIGGDHEAEVLAPRPRCARAAATTPFDQLEVEQRLAAVDSS